MKIRISTGNQAIIENLLMEREEYEEALILLKGDEALRILNKGLWAERKSTASGRIVWDLRAFNLISICLYSISVVPESILGHLEGDDFIGY